MNDLRRRVGALPADCPTGLDRATAYDVLSQLVQLQARRRHGPNTVYCPSCGQGFDIAYGVTTRPPGWRNPARRHPGPVAASATPADAEEVTKVLGTAMSSGSDRLSGRDAFWVDFGRCVLWPLLYLAHVTGADERTVRRWTHPSRLRQTMATVATQLDTLGPGPDPDRTRRQWDNFGAQRVAAQRVAAQRVAFSYAYGMIRHWELSPPLDRPEAG